MFGFSFSEIIVVLIVAVLVLKPEDVPILAKKFKELKNYFIDFKKEINKNIDQLTDQADITKAAEEDIEEINFYLKRIVELGSSYNGNYDLEEIRSHYKALHRGKMLEALAKDKDEQ
ncbi:MAG: hypothetical protein K0Q51_1335 [Rickettsiaceae bacterium]|jgi:Sec-independent protein translocase protein TatA|nr:hypothetical protein [Rickettsiaceae bacterium]